MTELQFSRGLGEHGKREISNLILLTSPKFPGAYTHHDLEVVGLADLRLPDAISP